MSSEPVPLKTHVTAAQIRVKPVTLRGLGDLILKGHDSPEGLLIEMVRLHEGDRLGWIEQKELPALLASLGL
jgi:hypothetical protein